MRIHFPAAGRPPKLSIGPTAPRPGPTFPRLLATEETAVMKSTPNALITSVARTKMPIKRMKNPQTLRRTAWETGIFPSFTIVMA